MANLINNVGDSKTQWKRKLGRDMKNVVKDVNSILNKWLWLSCNLFLCSFSLMAPPCWGFYSDAHLLPKCFNIIKDFFFFFNIVLILSHICKRQFKIGFDVYISENIISLLSSFRLGNTLYVLTHSWQVWVKPRSDWVFCSVLKKCLSLFFMFYFL